MGQYYKPVQTETKEWLLSHDYGNGMKLMEHSWIGNNFVAQVERLLAKGGAWHRKPIVWAGDYADHEGGTEDNLYSMCLDDKKLNLGEAELPEKLRFIVNHTRREFVDKDACPPSSGSSEEDAWRVHPLPLLTCEGNGRGGGDFHGNNSYIGSWSRDVISVEDKAPKMYKEIYPAFKE